MKHYRAACIGVLAAGVALWWAPTALAQYRDLVGARASSGETMLRQRGYHPGMAQEGRDAKFTYWRRGDECLQVTTRDGRYQFIVPAATSLCDAYGARDGGGSGSGAATAVVAGVALVGLAAAIAAHKKKHDDADAQHDRDYEQGYREGLYGGDHRGEVEGYHEGYLAGEEEARNRRHANGDYVGRAPRAAREACSRRADQFQNQPAGSSVPISVRPLGGGGDYELTMATGPYRSYCVVDSSGRVLEINPP